MKNIPIPVRIFTQDYSVNILKLSYDIISCTKSKIVNYNL